LTPDRLVLPLFIVTARPGEPIDAMPGQARLSIDRTIEAGPREAASSA
jgi:delta-aminolevulinic acid dehydratase/porphobilinogen synthase